MPQSPQCPRPRITPLDAPDHEALLRIEDQESGLDAIIAIHSTRLGPAAGGLRMRPYGDLQEAIEDVKRLSEGMTYKNAAAGLPLGGGKAVIIGDPETDKTPALLRAFGRAMESLAGRYYTAEDMGMSPADMAEIAHETAFVAGLVDGAFASGDPSPITARGIFNSIRSTLEHANGSANLAGLTIALQGLGHVGWQLAKALHQDGAKLVVCDPDPVRQEAAKQTFGATVVGLDEIYTTNADLFCPCAIGGVLNSETIPQLKVRYVVGGANNQLASDADGNALHERGILYAPDFVVNGGGIINVAAEILKIEDRARFVDQKLAALDQTLRDILSAARAQDVSPNQVAAASVDRIISQSDAA